MSKKYTDTSLSADIVRQLQQEGMTLKQIGHLVGLSESYVSYVRKGVRSFTVARLRKLEKALNRPLPLLLLQALHEHSVPKGLRPQYEALRQSLAKSAELTRHELEN